MLPHSVMTPSIRYVLCATVLLSACSSSDSEVPAEAASLPATEATITGAGSTFAAPIIESWIEAYRNVEGSVDISYSSVGSGEGINRFSAATVDLGATDAPLSEEELVEVHASRQLPLTAGMIGITYNMEGLEEPLKLSREAYAGIFLGTVERWDDPLIVANNPGADLPAKLIQLVARSDSSGTTHSFTEHLSAVSPEWAAGPGAGKRISWLGGTMEAAGNEGVAGHIKMTLGSIGYVNSGFAERLGLPLAILENRDGQFVAPTIETGQAAMASAGSDKVDEIAAAMIDPTGADSYPITTYTWFLLRDSYGSDDKTAAVKDLVEWTLSDGQDYAESLHYIPLPEAISSAALANLENH